MTLPGIDLLQQQCFLAPVNEKRVMRFHPFSGISMMRRKDHHGVIMSSNMMPFLLFHGIPSRPLLKVYTRTTCRRINVSKVEELLKIGDGNDGDEEESSGSKGKARSEDLFIMDAEERKEWRRKIREVLNRTSDVEEEMDLLEKRKRMQKLLAEYPLIVEEEDPDWPEDADGWGFNMGQFFSKISIKNVKKDDDENYDSENEIVWQDDDYIRPVKDITSAEWEEAIFKDISPLVVLVHNRYKRPKVNEKVHDELEKAVYIIWNCRLPSPRCVAIDANCEHDLVSALQVSIFPELIFTKAGKILYREKEMRTADELSKIMAFFYYGAAKPSCLSGIKSLEEAIPTVQSRSEHL